MAQLGEVTWLCRTEGLKLKPLHCRAAWFIAP